MGAGIAHAFLIKEAKVVLVERDEDAGAERSGLMRLAPALRLRPCGDRLVHGRVTNLP
jgi:hypothetical protein